MEGTVQISIQDFDNLRERADGYERKYKNLVKALNECTVEIQDHEVDAEKDEWIQIISLDAEKTLKLVAGFGSEFIDESDVLQFVNVDNIKIESIVPGENNQKAVISKEE
ncbi:hypothetical protein U2I53_10675 [Lysinibacillus capsici]|uniref:hypothetical protein n=1 Tax=Lysinibacillus capsici TaxID=2115968 RepID=UPI0032E00412